MSDLVARVAATGLVRAGEGVVVLLSGGRDSTCLLAVATRLGANVLALHVNHGLRAEADADEAHCHALCDRLGVGLLVERAAGPPEGNVQAWAREQRYGAARRVAGDVPIATGHTLSDQAETVLMRLAASPGRRALLGMATTLHGLVRPLLAAEVTRAETTAFCREAGLDWREDAGNEDPAFTRTRARDGLLPALHALDPRAERNIARTAVLLREEAAVLDGLVAEVLAGREDGLAVERLAALPRALGRLVLRQMAEAVTGGPCGRAGSRLEDVLALAPVGALDLGDGARAIVRGGVLRMDRTPRR